VTSIKKPKTEEKIKTTLHSFLMSSEPRPGPSSAKIYLSDILFQLSV